MVQPTPGQSAEDSAAAKDKKYAELIDCFLNDEKNEALKKHPELRAAYKAQETYEIFFLKGARDEVGLIAIKKKIARKVIGELVYGKSVGEAEK